MVTKYRCSRCLRTFDDAHEADQHDHEDAFDASVVREIEGREVETEQTGLADWGADAFQEASELEEADDE